MLEKIQIKGFQRHKRLTVEFDPITTIIGETDKGKSSFIKAIKFVAMNTPSGLDFLNWDSNQVTIRTFIDGYVIVRRKSKRITSYKLDQEETYKAFSTGVPKQIREILNLGEANFQDQHDAPFWLSKTSGMVSRELNKLVNLEIMDATLSNLTEYTNTAKTNQTSIQNRIESLKQQIKEARIVKQIDSNLSRLEEAEHKKVEIAEDCLSLANVLTAIQRQANDRDRAVVATSELRIALNTARKHREITIERESLLRLVGQARRARSQIRKRPPDLTRLGRCYQAYKKIHRRVEELHGILKDCNELENSLAFLRIEATRKQMKFEKAMGDMCPLCDQSIEKEKDNV